MSILIKGMEMPTSGELLVIITPNGEVRYKKSVASTWDRTTVVPVPPHGDLIDRKAIYLTDFEIAMCNGNYKEGMKMLLEKIESAPTIIPAEED